MKKRGILVLLLALSLLAGALPAHAAGDSQRWQTVKSQCEEQGLQMVWYPAYEGLMRRYGTGNMLLVEGGKSYLCKLGGDVKLAGPFDAFGEFNKDGLAPACQNGKWGMVDMDGNTGVDFIYADQYQAELAGETYPVFRGKDGKDTPPYALFTKQGTQLTEYKYQGHDRFVNGFAMVTVDGKDWGYVNAYGREITAMEFRHEALGTAKFSGVDDYGVFDEDGFAIVCTDEGFNVINRYHGWGMMGWPSPKKPWRAGYGLFGYVDGESGKVGFLDGNGGVVIEPRFDDRTTPKGFQETYFFDGNGLADVYENNEFFTIDRKGNRVDRSTFVYQPMGEDAIHEGLRRVQTGENGPWGFVNEAGETVIPALFDAVGYFDCGYASVLVDGVFGLLRNPRLTAGKTQAPATDLVFTDVPAGSWFEQGVMTCAKSGVMVGVGENVFSPNTTLTDAECAMLAYRIYDQAHGGDGSLMKMPQDYGYLKLVSDDGSFVLEGYAGDRNIWGTQIVFYDSTGYRLSPYGQVKMGPATVTFGGKEYRGEVKDGHRGSGRYPSDHFAFFEPEDPTFNALFMKACRMASPDCWWADLVYTIWEKGWEDVFPYYIYGREAWRFSFAELLGDVTNLPKRFDVPPIPDIGARGMGNYTDQVYELYEAGIIGGVDAYGTFEADKTLTRAEAAVMVARVLDESQRLSTPPKAMPADGEGYTLTYLMDGVMDSGFSQNTYPYYFVADPAVEGYQRRKGFLKLDGSFTPWPESETFFMVDWYGGNVFYWTNVYDPETEDGLQRYVMGALNDKLEWIIEPQYESLWPREGGFVATTEDNRYLLLDENGNVEEEVASQEELPERTYWEDLNEYWRAWENWNGLWLPDQYAEGQLYYRWRDGTPATQWFDWCGKIGPDGKGFVQKDGKIYLIEFARR